MFKDQAQETQPLLASQWHPSSQVVNGDVETLWTESINKKLDQADQDDSVLSWGQPCIYRIPAHLSESADKKTYIPKVVSIGPYHHGLENVKEMEQHKWRAIKHILRRTGQDINVYLDAMRALEARTRACYTGSINLTSNEFVEIMMLDGCFILEILRGVFTGFEILNYSENDPIFSERSTTLSSMSPEMLMLENQIPLFVLDNLLELQTDWPPQMRPVSMLALLWFQGLVGNLLMSREGDQEGLHFLDLNRQTVVITSRSRGGVHESPPLIPCVTDLINAGVDFKVKNTDKYWDITFEKGVIYMPKIQVHDKTRSLFFNFMAFEQCHVSLSMESCTITAYVILLDMLIDSTKDLSILRSCGIIEHTCASDAEAAYHLDSISDGVVFNLDDCYLAPLCWEVNAYCNRKWNVWRTTLKQQYFYNPWAIISFIAAFFLILLTIGQTFYSIYAYYVPSS